MGSIRQRSNRQGKTIYDVEIRRKGQPTAYRSFSRLTDARCWLQDMESDLRAGRYQPQAEAQRHTLTEAIQRYLKEDRAQKLKTYSDQKRQLLWFEELIGHKPLSEISPALLSELKSQYLEGVNRHGQRRQPQSWNRCLSALSSVLQMCSYDWQWLEHNPARRVRREREPRGRVRFLSDHEREALLAACKQSESPNLYPLVVLTLSTGMRRGEVTYLTWDRLDLNKGVIILDDTKNGERRRVPVCGLALELMRQHAKVRRLDTNFVFPGLRTQRSKQPFELACYWNKAVLQAGLVNFRFHDIRHCTASYLAMKGASMLEIAEVLGHRTLQMVKRYSHLAESHTALVLERMNREIFGG